MPLLVLVLLLTGLTAPAQTLSGAYTINSASPTAGTNFISFTAAATALNARGVSGPVTFDVSGGPYTEQFTLNQFAGTSAANRVTINGNGRTIQFGSGSSTQRAVIALDGADFVTVDSLNVDATVGGTSTATYGWGVLLVNNADNNVIRHCTVTSSTTSTSTFFAGIVASASTTSPTTAGAASSQNLTLEYNTVTGGYYGIAAVGNTTAAPNPGYILRGNRVRDFYFYGLYNLYLSGPELIGNDISRPTRSIVSSFYGIYLGTGVRGARVERNRIHQAFGGAPASTNAAYCLYITTGTAATATAPNDVINNLIYDVDGNGLVYGLYNPGSSYVRYYHNTVNIDDQTNTSSSATYGYYHTTGLGVEFKNNIVRITRSGSGAKYALYFSSATGANIGSNYNDLTGSGPDYNTGYYAGTDYATLAAWQAANSNAYDQNSVDADPAFVSAPTNLRPTSAVLNNVAQPLARVTDDFTGAARSATPDIGAYEFTPAANDVAVVSLTAPVAPVLAGARTVTVMVRNNGTAPLATVTLAYALNGGPAVTQAFTLATALASGAATALSFTTPATLLAGANTLVITATLPNGQPDPTPGNNTLSSTVYTALTGGAYTINSLQPTGGTNFISFTAAANALNNGGIAGTATFTVLNGPYTEQFQLNEISGTSATSAVVINGNGRTIQFGSTDAGQRAVVQLNGTDYTTINNLIIDATGGGTATYGFGVALSNAADNDRITNCVINADITTTSSNFVGISVSGSLSSATTSGNSANNLTLEGNTVNGGYYGISLYGNTAALTTDNVVRNNNVRDFYLYGIYSGYQDGPQFIGNDISRPLRTNGSTFYGLYLFGTARGAAIEKNRVHNPFDGNPTSTSAIYGLYLATGSGATATAPNDVVNNAVYNLNGNGLQYLIYNSGAVYSRIYNNTVSSESQTATTTSVTYGIYNSAANVDVRNNIVSITRTSAGTKYGLYYATAAATSNYNDLYVPGGNVGYNTTAYATLAAWQAANSGAFDQNSVSVAPQFVSAGTGNLQPANVALNNAGTPLARVTDDITGATRGALPDIGAYEFTPVSIDVAPFALVGPAAGAGCYGPAEPVIAQIRNAGTTTLNLATNPATVTVVVTPPTGPTQTFTTTVSTGTLASGATLSVTLPGTLDMTALGTYSFAITTTAVGDLNASNDVLTPAPTRTVVAPTAGTLSPASRILCVSGTVALTLAGSANGTIQYQSSPSATGTFADIAGATTAAYTTATLTATTYFRAKVSCNGRDAFSNVSAITVNNPVISSAPTPLTTCAGGTATLTATAPTGVSVRFYSAATGGTLVGTGSSVVTPAITANTTYYAEAFAGGQENVGAAAFTSFGQTPQTGGALFFTTTGPTTIAAVTVFLNAAQAAGTVTIDLISGSGTGGTVVSGQSTAFAVPAGPATGVAPYVVPLNYVVPAAGQYTLYLRSATQGGLLRDDAGANLAGYPYTSPSGTVSITSSSIGASYYYYFYNWVIGSECKSATRTPIQVNVTPGLVASLPVAAFSGCGRTPYPLAGTIAGTATGGVYTSTGTGVFTPNATTLNATYTPSAADVTAGTLTLTLTPTGPAAPCTTTAQVVLTLQTPPNGSFSYPTGVYCTGAAGTISPVLATGAVAGTFSITGAGLSIDPTTGVINLANTNVDGTFTVVNTLAGTGACSAFASTTTVTINFGVGTPTLTATPQTGGTVLLTATFIPGGSYQFYRNAVAVGAPITSNSLLLSLGTQSGSYTVVVTSAAGCSSAASAAVGAVVTGTQTARLSGVSLLVAPNPTADGHLTLELQGPLAAPSAVTVLNALGQVVHTGTATASPRALDLSGLAAGVYTVRVLTRQGTLIQRIVRE